MKGEVLEEGVWASSEGSRGREGKKLEGWRRHFVDEVFRLGASHHRDQGFAGENLGPIYIQSDS